MEDREARGVRAAVDFEAAASAALRVSGATLLDVQPNFQPDEMIVRFRFRSRRFECVVHKMTLQVVDAGICLTDSFTGERGDSYFTLESLPAVIKQAMDEGALVVFR